MTDSSSNSKPSNAVPPNRCRLVLVLTPQQIVSMGDRTTTLISAAAQGGDVASIIISQGDLEASQFDGLIRQSAHIAQQAGIAVIIDGDSRIAGRIGADGLHLGQDKDVLQDTIERHAPKMMIGAGNIKSRHNALILGETQPDYVMFGKVGGDTHDVPNPKNIDLGEWWSKMIEIPCIVMGGASVDSVVTVAKCGAEFVALSAAIFAPDESAKDDVPSTDTIAARIRQANELLDLHAPSFEDPDA